MLVVQLVRDVARTGLGGDEFHFADQLAAPGFIHLRAELAFHFFQLFLPGLAVGRDFQAALVAAHRARVPRERVATIWTSALATRGVIADIAAFTAKIAALPRIRLRSPRAPATSLPSSDKHVPAEAGSTT